MTGVWYRNQSSTTDALGIFEVGPFERERVTLRAMAYLENEDRAYAGEASADAGSRGVVIRLSPMGMIEGVVVDGDGQAIWNSSMGFSSQSGGMLGYECERGDFAVPVGSGTYAVSAWLKDGRFGLVRDVIVSPGKTTSDLRVEVRRGSTLNLVYAGSESMASFRVLSEEAVVVRSALEVGLHQSVIVPPGDLVVDLWDGRERFERRVHVDEGGEAGAMFP